MPPKVTCPSARFPGGGLIKEQPVSFADLRVSRNLPFRSARGISPVFSDEDNEKYDSTDAAN